MSGVAMGLPTGRPSTFLFTDIEGSTRWSAPPGARPGPASSPVTMPSLRAAIDARRGAVARPRATRCFAAFGRPDAAVAAAESPRNAPRRRGHGPAAGDPGPDGLHLGEGRLRTGSSRRRADYVGIDVNYTARIAAAGNGGQVILSDRLVTGRSQGSGPSSSTRVCGRSRTSRSRRDCIGWSCPARRTTRGRSGRWTPRRTCRHVTALIGRDAEIEALAEP